MWIVQKVKCKMYGNSICGHAAVCYWKTLP